MKKRMKLIAMSIILPGLLNAATDAGVFEVTLDKWPSNQTKTFNGIITVGTDNQKVSEKSITIEAKVHDGMKGLVMYRTLYLTDHGKKCKFEAVKIGEEESSHKMWFSPTSNQKVECE
ncbi:MAG: hypothetical protein COB67_02400 [SAR324 cluster bacterium]|uniref:Uncharacterized protein n=1 Tax=SAR324 cluster bacterium TaxID=2024889 RepID=A0A2A4TAK4_9DELT|nr:MAG: hypothetical protein COB67_02400 [SAR324 cluster bacterium]